MDRLKDMNRLYFDPRQPGSFGGLPAAERLNVDVKSWLIRQDAYRLDKPIRHRFRRRQTFTTGIHDLWQTDLVDMQSLSNHNDGVKFLLTCIDTFLKYTWVRPLQKVWSKRHRSIQADFERRDYLMLQDDKGTEFKNVQVQSLLKKYDIKKE